MPNPEYEANERTALFTGDALFIGMSTNPLKTQNPATFYFCVGGRIFVVTVQSPYTGHRLSLPVRLERERGEQRGVTIPTLCLVKLMYPMYCF